MLIFKFLALIGAALGLYVAAALQSSPEVADANLCKLLRRISSALPDQCLPSLDDYGTAIAVIFVLACVLLLLWDFRKHVFVSVKVSAAIKRLWLKVEPYLIPIGVVVIIVGAIILGLGAYKERASASAMQSELNAIKTKIGQIQTPTSNSAITSRRPVSGLEVVQRLEQLETDLADTRKKLTEARQPKAPTTRLANVEAPRQLQSSIPVTTTAAADIPRKLDAIDSLRSILTDHMAPWINKGNGLTTGAWWNWVAANDHDIPKLKNEVRDFWQKGQEIDEKIRHLQKDNERFPDIYALAQSPLGSPFLLKMEKFATPILALPDDMSTAKEFYRHALEPAAKEAYATLSSVEQWRATTDRKALELRQQLSR